MAEPEASTAVKSGDGKAADAPEKSGSRHKFSERTRCRFCREGIKRIDYKEVTTLQEFCRGQGRIISRKRSRNCAQHQRMVKRAIKLARFIGLLSYTEGQHVRR